MEESPIENSEEGEWDDIWIDKNSWVKTHNLTEPSKEEPKQKKHFKIQQNRQAETEEPDPHCLFFLKLPTTIKICCLFLLEKLKKILHDKNNITKKPETFKLQKTLLMLKPKGIPNIPAVSFFLFFFLDMSFKFKKTTAAFSILIPFQYSNNSQLKK